MFARSDDPYRGADLADSRRVVAALIGFSALLSLAFLPLDPPTEAIGAGGCWRAGLSSPAVLCGRPRACCAARSRFDALLAAAYLAPVQIAVLVWLAGGVSADYEDLYVFALGRRARAPAAAGVRRSSGSWSSASRCRWSTRASTP